MAIIYTCDDCGKEINRDNGIISEKELTIEFDDSKISILISINNHRFKLGDTEYPALCNNCFTKTVANWNLTGTNFLDKRKSKNK